MPSSKREILAETADYYSAKLAQFGQTPQGVDWNGEKGQLLRFAQLCRVIDRPGNFSISDLGCGYGALFDYLQSRYDNISYFGYDISTDMVEAARASHVGANNAVFLVSSDPANATDFCVASGIFNVKQGRSEAEWQTHIEATLEVLSATSSHGFAFNCLTSYSDPDRMRSNLFYADPCRLFDLCKRKFSRHVALLHDYGLFEFTIIVRKFA